MQKFKTKLFDMLNKKQGTDYTWEDIDYALRKNILIKLIESLALLVAGIIATIITLDFITLVVFLLFSVILLYVAYDELVNIFNGNIIKFEGVYYEDSTLDETNIINSFKNKHTRRIVTIMLPNKTLLNFAPNNKFTCEAGNEIELYVHKNNVRMINEDTAMCSNVISYKVSKTNSDMELSEEVEE